MIRYNGYKFSDYSNVSVDMQPVYDEADRVVVALRYTINIRAIIVASEAGAEQESYTCNDNARLLSEIRKQLNAPGRELIFTGLGFGGLSVNDEDNGNTPADLTKTRDIQSGPKPRELKWTPVGAESAAEINWSVETVVSCCEAEGVSNFTGLMALNYGVSHQINRAGFTTRTVSGYLQIAQSQFDDNGVMRSTDSADDYRDSIQVEVLPNAHREQSYNLSTDKSRLDFSIVDTEIESPNSYPPGVVSIRAPFRTKIEHPRPGEIQTPARFSIDMELDALTPRTRAWEIARALLNIRVGGFADDGREVILTSMEFEEDWFTHRFRFDFGFYVTVSLEEYLQLSRVYTAFPVDWVAWSESMEEAQSNRGSQGLAHERTDENDRLTNLCDQENVEVGRTQDEDTISPGDLSFMCGDPPLPERSWILFDAQLVEAPQLQNTVVSTYGDFHGRINEIDGIDDTEESNLLALDDREYEQNVAATAPQQRWIWRGRAQRLGHPIPPMGKCKIGGKDAIPVGTPRISHRLLGYLFCWPLYECIWNIGLVVLDDPPEIPEPEERGPDDPDYVPGGWGQED